LAQLYHPDKVKEEEQESVKEKFQIISEAYSVLIDFELRAQYDATLMASQGRDFKMTDEFMNLVHQRSRRPYTSYFKDLEQIDPFYAKWSPKERIH
jgi:DnaJ-class molecular chaperone